jgi:phospholipid-transporting ATPase
VGTATINGAQSPVDSDCVLLRGSVLRNTTFVLGLVVYAGRQSKIQMNSKASAAKRSNVERMSNLILAGVLGFEIIMCSLGCIGNYAWAAGNRETWYMPFVKTQTSSDVLLAWVTYFILLNNYIPISLYVSMELAKLGQKVLIDNDLEMYHELTDTPCLARTSNLNEELGQIQYIFSDKTGTLTRNEMEFRKCWIAGTSYGFGTTEIGLAAAARGALLIAEGDMAARRDADPRRAQFHHDPKLAFDDVRLRLRLEEAGHADAGAIRDFLRVLSVAHTVVPETDEPGDPTPATVTYQAESPDESALVLAAKALGFFFCGKTATAHRIRVCDGEPQQFEMLNINKFNSTRKRMSAVVRTPEGGLELYVKGADNVMLERISKGSDTQPVSDAVKMYGKEGLRTLIIAKRTIPEEEYAEWSKMYHAASTALTDREQRLMDAAEEIERDLEILGATAIEDKLQIGVPEAIATLAKARIRIWVLTGDKQETAENIGFACNLLTEEMDRIYLVDDRVEELKRAVDDANLKWQYTKSEVPCEKLSLIVDGKALFVVMRAVENPAATSAEVDLMLAFLELAKMCKAVIACRVSPDQKRQIVAMVRLHSKPTPLTLSIGDGANDVPMILEASVGIGISGNEGMQAVRSADYAIAQFAYLKRLLLVHGRSNYKRTSAVIMYSLYKNCFLVSTLFLYSFWTGWTGTAIFDSLMLAGYNVGWAFVGIILYGSIESDVSAKAAMQHPELYATGARQADFNMRVLVRWEATAFVHTVLCLLVPTYCFMGRIVHAAGYDAGQAVFGLCVMQALVFAVNLKLMLATANLTWLSVAAYLGSMLLFIIGGLSHSTWALSSLFASESYVFYFVAMVLYESAATWLIQLLTVVIVLLPDVILAYLRRTYLFSNSDIVREIDQGFAPPVDSPRPALPA